MAKTPNWKRYSHRLQVQAQRHAAQGLVALPEDDEAGDRDYTVSIYTEDEVVIKNVGADYILFIINLFGLDTSTIPYRDSQDTSKSAKLHATSSKRRKAVNSKIRRQSIRRLSLSDISDTELWFSIYGGKHSKAEDEVYNAIAGIQPRCMISIVKTNISTPRWSNTGKSKQSVCIPVKYISPIYESTIEYIQESGDWISNT